jgi:hypothetical protein
MSAFDPAASAIVDASAIGDHCATSVDGAVVAVTCATPAASGRTTGTVALYAAEALPPAEALPVAPADESFRRLGSVKPAFHALVGAPAAPGGTPVSSASRATTRVTRKPARKPTTKPKPKPKPKKRRGKARR